MPIDREVLKSAPRLLIEVALKPVVGTRIQPTGFPDLGPALYEAPGENGSTIPTLLVESAQSMANRLEAVCWDEETDDLAPELKGLPYVSVNLVGLPGEGNRTSSLQEFHRLNSPYIMSGVTGEGKTFADVLKPELGMASVAGRPAAAPRRGRAATAPTAESAAEPAASGEKEPDDVAGVVNLRKLAAVCFKYDTNALIHGIFLEKIAGRLRHPRALSAFIEASGVERADSGGVKFDRALPKPSVAGLKAEGGYGNVPFHRTEFTAKSIAAFFLIDLGQIRGYGLPDPAAELLAVLSLWKVRKFLDSSMRLRTACELELAGNEIACRYKDPDRKDQQFPLPPVKSLSSDLRSMIERCKPHFADPAVTALTWNNPRA